MNFNVYLDDETGLALNRAAKQSGASRNALIRQALDEWLQRRSTPRWPSDFLEFTGAPDLPPFEVTRRELAPLADDPLA